MSHQPPFPRGATGAEIQAIQKLHHAAEMTRDRDARKALADAVELIAGLIEGRSGRRDLDAQWDDARADD